MINCSYFSTNNLIFSSNNDIIQFQKTHIVFFETEQPAKETITKNQEPRTKRLGDWNWNWDWDCIFLIQLFNLFQNK